MKLDNVSNYQRGWVLGNFNPSLFNSDVEVGIHRHSAGTIHEAHYHLLANEINIIISGECIFNFVKDKEVYLKQNDIVIVEKGEVVEFKAITDCVICVIKDKSVIGDKYLYNE